MVGPQTDHAIGERMSLTPEEIERYARHLVLREIGGPGQQKLKAARVLVIGAGGLGAPLLQYLAGAGVGVIGVVDDDAVSLSNLQRQVIHATGDVGRAKVESAQGAIHRLNPHVQVEPHRLRLTPENARALIGALRFDLPYLLFVCVAVGVIVGSLFWLALYGR